MINVEKNYKQVMIGNSVAAVSGTVAAASTVLAYTQLADGEATIVNERNVVLDATTVLTAPKIKILLRNGTNLVTSDIIEAGRLTQYTSKKYAAATQQVDYIGYNGTTGSIAVTDYTMYTIRLKYDDHRERKVKYGFYKSGASATQILIATSLHTSLCANLVTPEEKAATIKAELVCDDAGVQCAATGGAEATHLQVVNGSKYITGVTSAGAAALGTDETHANLITGAYIRVGSAVTDPVYKIVKYSAGTATTPMILELNAPYQGATAAATAITGFEYITAVLAAAASWGIKLTGLAQTYTPGASTYSDNQVRFTTLFQESVSGTTLITNSTGASFGNGTYAQAYEDSAWAAGNVGSPFRQSDWGPVPADFVGVASSSATYDVLNLKWTSFMQSDLGPVNNSLKELTYYAKTDSSSAHYLLMLQILDAWVGSTSAYYNPALSAQVGNIT